MPICRCAPQVNAFQCVARVRFTLQFRIVVSVFFSGGGGTCFRPNAHGRYIQYTLLVAPHILWLVVHPIVATHQVRLGHDSRCLDKHDVPALSYTPRLRGLDLKRFAVHTVPDEASFPSAALQLLRVGSACTNALPRSPEGVRGRHPCRGEPCMASLWPIPRLELGFSDGQPSASTLPRRRPESASEQRTMPASVRLARSFALIC